MRELARRDRQGNAVIPATFAFALATLILPWLGYWAVATVADLVGFAPPTDATDDWIAQSRGRAVAKSLWWPWHYFVALLLFTLVAGLQGLFAFCGTWFFFIPYGLYRFFRHWIGVSPSTAKVVPGLRLHSFIAAALLYVVVPPIIAQAACSVLGLGLMWQLSPSSPAAATFLVVGSLAGVVFASRHLAPSSA